MITTLRLTPIALAVLLPLTIPAQSLDTLAWRDTLRAEMTARGAPGAAVAVVVNGRAVWQHAEGRRSVEQDAPVTSATLFRIGSVTKMFTGLLAAELAQRGVVNLDAPIGRIVPSLTPALHSITLAELLTHRGGVINLAARDGSHDDAALGARVASWRDDMVFAPRDDIYSYSSPGYWLAGHLLERAGGAPYADLLAERILAPLGARESTVRPLMAMTREVALDHVRASSGEVIVQRPFLDDASTWPSGSLFASARDLARVATALVRDGVVEDAPGLPAAVIKRALQPVTAPGGGPHGYALGLAASRRGKSTVLTHYGFRAGSGAVFTVIPEHGIAVIILANGPGAILSRTEGIILRSLMESTRGTPAPSNVTTWALEPAHYIQGTDTLQIIARDNVRLLVARGDTLGLSQNTSGDLVARTDAGQAVGRFTPVVGRSGQRYLHDGLSAYRWLPPISVR